MTYDRDTDDQIPVTHGGATGSVRNLLRLEGVALFAGAVPAYFLLLDQPWWLFPVLFLAPDLSFIAMIAGKRALAMAYNAAHTTILPLGLIGIGFAIEQSLATGVALIWLAHIGADRAIGYGLRYPESFEHTHLGPVGRARAL